MIESTGAVTIVTDFDDLGCRSQSLEFKTSDGKSVMINVMDIMKGYDYIEELHVFTQWLKETIDSNAQSYPTSGGCIGKVIRKDGK